MFIALSISLILVFALAFWILKESSVPFFFKVLAITLAFVFCVLFSPVWESTMGWAAKDKYVPSIVSIRHVVIKEPNEQLQFAGSIYLLLESAPTKYDSLVMNIFAYKTDRSEPRLFRLPYSRDLHEELQKNVMPSNAKGQIVTGKLQQKGKGKGKGKGKDGKPGEGDGKDGQGKDGKGKDGKMGKGGGDDSLEKEFTFYVLPPSYFLKKE